MALKAFLASIDGLAEHLKPLYTKTDDGYVLDLDDKDFKTRLDEFRTNNRNLTREKAMLEEAIAKSKHIDPEKYAEAMEALKALDAMEDAELLKKGKFEEVIKKRTQAMATEYENRMKGLQTSEQKLREEQAALESMLGRVMIESTVLQTLGKVGTIKAGAQDDVINRAMRTWKFDPKTRQLVAKNDAGEVIYDEKGDPLSVDKWGQTLVKSAPFLFEAASGGGSGGGQKGNGLPAGKKTIDSRDIRAFGDNIEKIAKGEVTVVGADHDSSL